MKRLFTGILAMTTLLLSSCGSSPKAIRKCRCESYSIRDDFSVFCRLVDDNYEQFDWYGFIHYWSVDKSIKNTFWYELDNGEYALRVGIN